MRRLLLGAAARSRSPHDRRVRSCRSTTRRSRRATRIAAIYQEYLLETEQAQHAKLCGDGQAPQRLCRTCARYALARRAALAYTRRRTSSTRTAYNDALDLRRPARGGVPRREPPGAERTGRARTARHRRRDASWPAGWRRWTWPMPSAIAATNDTGQLRFNGRRQELPAIDALEADVIDPSLEQSTTAVLDKISGAGPASAHDSGRPAASS